MLSLPHSVLPQRLLQKMEKVHRALEQRMKLEPLLALSLRGQHLC